MIELSVSDKVIGTCGSCQGPIVVPRIRVPLKHYVPKCKKCNKVPKGAYGAEKEMHDAEDSQEKKIGF